MGTFHKAIKGNDNEQVEEFSHNKVTVNVNGAAPIILVCFLILLLCAAFGWLAIHYGALLALLGLALVLVAFTCAVTLLVARTYTGIGIMHSQWIRAKNSERFLYAPEGSHSIYLQDPRYDVLEVTANVIAAGVPMMLPPPEEKKLTADDQTIVEMWADGQMTLEQIVDALKPAKVSYYKVQKVISDAKARGVVRKN